MVAVFLPLLMCSHAMTQEEAYVGNDQAAYNGPTEFVYRDPTLGPNVYVQYNLAEPMPYWFVPPYGWEVLTAELAATAIIAATFPFYYNWEFGGVYFRDAIFIQDRYRGRIGHFHDFNRRIGRGFNSHFHRIANGRHFDPKMAKRSMESRNKGEVRKPGTDVRRPGANRSENLRGPKSAVSGPQHNTPNAVRGPRSPSTPQGAGSHQPGPGNVRSPRGPAGSPAIQPNVGGPRQPQEQVRRPQAGPVNRAPQVQRGPAAAAPRGPAARPAPAAKAPAAKAAPPAKKQ